MNMPRVLCAGALVLAAVAPMSAAHAQGKDPPGVNPAHYQCYRITEQTAFKHVGVTLKDQFNASEAKVLKPILLCAPTSKNGAPVKDPKTHLVCYQEDGAKAAGQTVTITNQFGTEKVVVGGPTMLCVPTVKTVVKP